MSESAPGWLGVLLAVLLAGCGFLPIQSLRPGTTVLFVLPPDKKAEVVLYTPDMRTGAVDEGIHELVVRGELYSTLLKRLLEGEPGSRFVPNNTRLLCRPTLRDGVLYVNFSKEMKRVQRFSSKEQTAFLKALVYTLTEDPQVQAVRLLLENEAPAFSVEGVDFLKPVGREAFVEHLQPPEPDMPI